MAAKTAEVEAARAELARAGMVAAVMRRILKLLRSLCDACSAEAALATAVANVETTAQPLRDRCAHVAFILVECIAVDFICVYSAADAPLRMKSYCTRTMSCLPVQRHCLRR